MKKLLLIVLCCAAFMACRDTKKEQNTSDIEINSDYDDSMDHPDSIEKYQSPPIINQDKIKKPVDQ